MIIQSSSVYARVIFEIFEDSESVIKKEVFEIDKKH